LNHRPLGYEPNELPDCSTPQLDHSNRGVQRQTSALLERGSGSLNAVMTRRVMAHAQTRIYQKLFDANLGK
jgi:hypothetical protein